MKLWWYDKGYSGGREGEGTGHSIASQYIRIYSFNFRMYVQQYRMNKINDHELIQQYFSQSQRSFNGGSRGVA